MAETRPYTLNPAVIIHSSQPIGKYSHGVYAGHSRDIIFNNTEAPGAWSYIDDQVIWGCLTKDDPQISGAFIIDEDADLLRVVRGLTRFTRNIALLTPNPEKRKLETHVLGIGVNRCAVPEGAEHIIDRILAHDYAK